MSDRILKSISEKMLARKETLAVAESVTGGVITATLSLSSNATKFLQGGLTAYNLGQKTRQLQVDPIHAEETNSVSDTVALQMASGVARLFCSDWGIAITGYAVPVQALKIRSCFALYAIVYRDNVLAAGRIDTTLTGQARVQRFYTQKVLAQLNRVLA